MSTLYLSTEYSKYKPRDPKPESTLAKQESRNQQILVWNKRICAHRFSFAWTFTTIFISGNALQRELFACNEVERLQLCYCYKRIMLEILLTSFIAYFKRYLCFKWISCWMLNVECYIDGIWQQIKPSVVCTTCDGLITTKWNCYNRDGNMNENHSWGTKKSLQLTSHKGKINYLVFYGTVMFNIHKSHFIRFRALHLSQHTVRERERLELGKKGSWAT